MHVGGFNPFEKYESKWESSPGRGENKKCLKPPPSMACLANCFPASSAPHTFGSVFGRREELLGASGNVAAQAEAS